MGSYTTGKICAAQMRINLEMKVGFSLKVKLEVQILPRRQWKDSSVNTQRRHMETLIFWGNDLV